MSVHFGAPAGSQRWLHSMLWKLGSFIFLTLLKRSDCLANPSYLPDNNPSVNIYMSLEEVKKLLGKDDAGLVMALISLLSELCFNFIFPSDSGCVIHCDCYTQSYISILILTKVSRTGSLF